MSLLKEIGAILGFVAFGGLAVLVFMTFQQARHLRRLREWAGRQPERAAAEEERVADIASEPGAAGFPSAPLEPAGPSRLDRIRGEVAFRFEEIDRRSPADPRLLLGGVIAIVVAVGIVTSGFGLLGSDEPGGTTTVTEEPAVIKKTEVAVLNGTAPALGEVGVEGIARKAAKEVRSLETFKVGAIGDAGSFETSTVMFEDGRKSEAKELATDLEPLLGETEFTPITPEVQAVSDGAKLALIVGLDDAAI